MWDFTQYENLSGNLSPGAIKTALLISYSHVAYPRWFCCLGGDSLVNRRAIVFVMLARGHLHHATPQKRSREREKAHAPLQRLWVAMDLKTHPCKALNGDAYQFTHITVRTDTFIYQKHTALRVVYSSSRVSAPQTPTGSSISSPRTINQRPTHLH